MKKYMMILYIAFATVFVFVACDRVAELESPQTEPPQAAVPIEAPPVEEIYGIFYQFDDLGFSFVLPSSWEGTYGLGIHEFENEAGTTRFVNVFHPATREELENDELGWLFSIIRVPWYVYENPVGIILAYDGEYSFLLNIPTDVQWNYIDPESMSAPEYREMSEQVWLIASSFEMLD